MNRFLRCYLSPLLLILCAAGPAFADNGAPGAGAAAESVSMVGGSGAIVQMFLGLFAVLLLIFLLAWAVRRLGPGSFMSNPHLKVLASLALGPRERLVIVAAGPQQLLLGVAPGRITTLHVFDEPVISPGEPQISSDFANKLQFFLQKAKKQDGLDDKAGS